jgi:hypothetical protein
MRPVRAEQRGALLGRSKRMVTGYDGVVEVAMERVAQFLGQQGAAG